MGLSDYMQRLQMNQKLTDVKFLVEGETISAHKVIVVRDSTVWECMLYEWKLEEEVIVIEDIDLHTFNAYLYFQYTDTINDLSISSLAKLYKCADKYDCQPLMEKCMSHLDQDCADWSYKIIEVFMNLRGVMVKDGILHDKCVRMLDENIVEAVKCDQFFSLPLESLEFLLKRDELCAKEELLLNSLVEWGNMQLEAELCGFTSLQEVLDPVIKYIRFTSLSTLQEIQPLLDILTADDLLPQEVIFQIKCCVFGNKNRRTKMKAALQFQPRPRIFNQSKIVLVGGIIHGKYSSKNYIFDVNNGCKLNTELNRGYISPNIMVIFNQVDRDCISLGGDCRDGQFYFTNLHMFTKDQHGSVNSQSRFIHHKTLLKNKHISGCYLGGKYYCIGVASLDIPVFGISHTVIEEQSPTSGCMTFDVVANQWTAVKSLPVSVSGAATVTYKKYHDQDVILLFGGVADGKYLDTVYEYQPSMDTWTKKDDLHMPKPLWRMTATVYGENIVICGGCSGLGNAHKECYTLNVRQSVWSRLPPMNYARVGHRALVYDGDLLVLGGATSDKGKHVNNVEIFDGQEWIEGALTPKFLTEFDVGVV